MMTCCPLAHNRIRYCVFFPGTFPCGFALSTVAGTHIAGVVGPMLGQLWAELVAGLGVAPGTLAETWLDGHHVALRGEDVAARRVVQGVVLVKELRKHRGITSLIHMPHLIHPSIYLVHSPL